MSMCTCTMCQYFTCALTNSQIFVIKNAYLYNHSLIPDFLWKRIGTLCKRTMADGNTGSISNVRKRGDSVQDIDGRTSSCEITSDSKNSLWWVWLHVCVCGDSCLDSVPLGLPNIQHVRLCMLLHMGLDHVLHCPRWQWVYSFDRRGLRARSNVHIAILAVYARG